jgi:hypothetical protein
LLLLLSIIGLGLNWIADHVRRRVLFWDPSQNSTPKPAQKEAI